MKRMMAGRSLIFIIICVLLLATPAFAARLVTSGFEMNSLTAAVENQLETVTNTTSALSIVTSPARSGTYALKTVYSTAVGTVTFNFTPLATGNTQYYRFYFRAHTLPSADATVAQFKIASGSAYLQVNLLTDGKLKFTDGANNYGTTASALTLDKWYRVEVSYVYATGASIAKLDGTQFGSGTTTTARAMNQMDLGILQTTLTTGEWYFDDVAVNDSTGSYQNSYPGAGNVIQLMPNADGEYNDWSFSTGTTLWSLLDEIPPNTTDYMQSNTVNKYFFVNFADSPASLTDGSINVVHLGARYVRSASNPASAQFQLEKAAAGTKANSGTGIVPTSSATTNANTAPRLYPITLYQDPDNTNWTKSTIDSIQAGGKITATNTNYFRITTLWLTIDYVAPDPDGNAAVTGEGTTTSTGNIPSMAFATGSEIDTHTGAVHASDGYAYALGQQLYTSTGSVIPRQYHEFVRLVSSGFETGSATAGVENQLEYVTGTAFSVVDTTKRSGQWSGKFLPSSSNGYATYQHDPLTTGNTIYHRFYLDIHATPAQDIYIFKGKIDNDTVYYGIKLTQSNTLQLTDGTTQIGSDSSALPMDNFENRIELSYNYSTGAIEARLNGTEFASGTVTASKAINKFDLGCIDTTTYGEWYIDDVAVNTGYWAEEGHIVHLRPNGNVAVSWNGTTPHYQYVSLTPPTNDYVWCDQNNSGWEWYGVTDINMRNGIANVVHLGYRFARSGNGPYPQISSLIKTMPSGTTYQHDQTPNNTSFVTNQLTAPRDFAITSYVDPDGKYWTNDLINNMQIGLYCEASGYTGGGGSKVNNIWAVVDFTYPTLLVDPVVYYLKSVTYNSFKLTVNQGEVTGGTFTADKFYISETPILSEPQRTPDITLTDLGNTEIEFTGLEPDRLYYVAAYRYVNGAYYSKGEPGYHWSDGFTLINTQRVQNDQSSITIDWSTPVFRQILPLHAYWSTGGADHKENGVTTVADPTHELGGDYYLHMCDAGIPYATGRWLFDIHQPITFEFDFRIGDGNMPLGAGPEFAFYSAETQYAGIIFFPETGGTGDYSPYGLYSDQAASGEWQFNEPLETYTRNSVHHMKIEKPGTGVRNLNFYIDDVLIAQFTKGFDMSFPAYLWMASSSNSTPTNGGTCYSGGVNMDVGPITMTGTLVWGNVDYSRSMFWDFNDRGQAAVIVGQEGPSSVASTFTQIGGITSNIDGYAAVGILGWFAPTTTTNPHTWVYRTPVVKPAFGYKYSSLELLARQSTIGSVKVQIKDRSGNLVSDSYITGNSTGFFPDVTAITTVDLSSVPYAGIQLEITGTSTSSDVAISNSPLMKYSAIKFATGSIVDITIDPVTSPTSIATQTITGSRTAGTTVSVEITSGTVGTVTYPTSTTWSVDLSDLCEAETITATATDGTNTASELAFINDTISCGTGDGNATVTGTGTTTSKGDVTAQGGVGVNATGEGTTTTAGTVYGSVPGDASVTGSAMTATNIGISTTPFVTGQTFGSDRYDYSDFVGFRFTVGASDIVVTDLGRWIRSGSQYTHVVKITDNSNNTIGSVTVDASSGAGDYKYVALGTPITLTAGTTYNIGSQEVSGGDHWYNDDGTTLTYNDSVATVPNSVFWGGSVIYTHQGLGYSYGPVNFKYQTGGGGAGVTATGTGNTTTTGTGTTMTAGTVSPTGTASITVTGTGTTTTPGDAYASAVVNGDASLTGEGTTTTAGTSIPTGYANVTPTGTGTTTTVGTATVTGLNNITVTGIGTTTTAGTAAATGINNAVLTGQGTTTTAGTATVTGINNATASGTGTTTSSGTVTITGLNNAAVTGTGTTTSNTAPTVTGINNITATGSGTTTSNGIITATGTGNANLTGEGTTTTYGIVYAETAGSGNAAVTGQPTTTSTGNLSPTGTASVTMMGSVATTTPGTVTIVGITNAATSGTGTTTTTGTLTATGYGSVQVSGTGTTTTPGDAYGQGAGSGDAIASTTLATTSTGNVSVIGINNVTVTGTGTTTTPGDAYGEFTGGASVTAPSSVMASSTGTARGQSDGNAMVSGTLMAMNYGFARGAESSIEWITTKIKGIGGSTGLSGKGGSTDIKGVGGSITIKTKGVK